MDIDLFNCQSDGLVGSGRVLVAKLNTDGSFASGWYEIGNTTDFTLSSVATDVIESKCTTYENYGQIKDSINKATTRTFKFSVNSATQQALALASLGIITPIVQSPAAVTKEVIIAKLDSFVTLLKKNLDSAVIPFVTKNNAQAISSITLVDNDPVQVVFSGTHNFTTGDKVTFRDIIGTTELNKAIYTVNLINTTTIELDGTDSAEFTAYVSGGAAYTAFENSIDYDFNSVFGAIYAKSSGSIVEDDALLVDYSVKAISGYTISSDQYLDFPASVMLNGHNLNDGLPLIITINKTKLTPSGDIPVMSGDIVNFEFSGTILSVPNKAPFTIERPVLAD